MPDLDPHTLRVVAGLIRSRMSRLDMDTRMDGLQRLGAARALKELAVDFEVAADHVRKPSRDKKSAS